MEDFIPELKEARQSLIWDEGPYFAINRSTVGLSMRNSVCAGEDELEEARGGLVYDEKTIVSSTTPLLAKQAPLKWQEVIDEFFELRKMHEVELKTVRKI